MRFRVLSALLVFGLLAVVGCDDGERILVADPVPAAPQGVYSITGDRAVYIYWFGPYESDIVEYIIWRSDRPREGYGEIGRRPAEDNPKLDLVIYEYIDENVDNGKTYFYAVSSVDQAGQVSELSAEEVFDTPRPEGLIVLFDAAVDSTRSGYLFADSSYADILVADVYVDRFDGIFYLNATDVNTDIQDMGFTESFDDIGYAPQDGWSEVGSVEIISGHTYVIWTRDLHFAKMRVESINLNSITFRWAYQQDPENPELIARPNGLEKPVHEEGYLRKDNKSTSLNK